MVCRKPFRGLFGCGQCMPCRIGRRGIWSHRCLLESFLHDHNSFVTLTYNDEFLPEGGTLVRVHPQEWLKRLRERIAPLRIRVYGVGEYGDRSMRPHYHALLFGFAPCMDPPLPYQKRIEACRCKQCLLISDTWEFGFSDLRHFSRETANYVAGYVTKKMTSDKSDYQKNYLKGRLPEFPFMSNRPGIGAGAMKAVAHAEMLGWDLENVINSGDVTTVLQHGVKKLALGRYLRRKLREEMGFSNTGAQDGWLLRRSEELCALSEDYYASGQYEKTGKHYFDKVLEERNQKILNIERMPNRNFKGDL